MKQNIELKIRTNDKISKQLKKANNSLEEMSIRLIKKSTVRIPLRTSRIIGMLQWYQEFGTIQDVSLDAIKKRIQDIFDEKPEIKKVVDDALKTYSEPDITVIDEL